MRRALPPLPARLAPALFVLAYVLLGLAWAMAAPQPAGGALDGAARAARLDDLALWLLAVALAAAAGWRPAAGSLSLAGPAVALTPTAVFLGATGHDGGLLLAAAVALCASALRLADERRGRWLAAATASAALLALGAAASGGVAAPDGPGAALRDGLRELGPLLVAAGGRFAPGDVALAPLGLVVWAAALLALVLAADRVAGTAGRRALWTTALACAVAAAVLYAAAQSVGGPGEPLPGRAALALLVPVPLLAGWLVARAGLPWWPRLGAGCFGLLALVQLLGWLAATDAAPGAGASPWAAAALLGGAALAAAGACTPATAPPVRTSRGPTAGTRG